MMFAYDDGFEEWFLVKENIRRNSPDWFTEIQTEVINILNNIDWSCIDSMHRNMVFKLVKMTDTDSLASIVAGSTLEKSQENGKDLLAEIKTYDFTITVYSQVNNAKGL